MKTVGLLSPNLDESKLEDARAILPPGIELHGRAFPVRRYDDAEFAKVESGLLAGLERIAGERLDFLMVTGELFFAHIGHARHRELSRQIADVTGGAGATIVTAVMNAFSALGLRRIAVATPFAQRQTDHLTRFLNEEGLEVVGQTSLGYESSESVWELPPETGRKAATELLRSHPDADGVYLPNNQWRVTSVIESLEREFDKPVVANTPAWIREALKGMGAYEPIAGYGRLLTS